MRVGVVASVGVLRCGAFALALLCAGACRAEVRIEGDEASLRVVTNQATLAEVLSALKAKFRLHYGMAIDSSRQINGTVSGSLHRVVAQLLNGHDFVMRRGTDGVEIVQLAPRGTANYAPQARPGATVWQTPAAQAMAPPR